MTAKAEQETIFRWADDGVEISIFTAHPPTQRRLARLGLVPWRVSRQAGHEVGWFYKTPRTTLRWRIGPPPKRRPLTDADRQALANRLAKSRVARNSP